VAAAGLVLNAPGFVVVPRAAVAMGLARLPGEGDPFNDGNMRDAEALATPQPRGITDGTAVSQYIEIDDEPWHSTCKQTTTITKASLEAGLLAVLPFTPAEDALDEALLTADSDSAIDAAVKKCLADGGRDGCPAIEAATKRKAALAKAAKDGKKAPAYKPIKPPPGGATPGFPNQGEGRMLGKVHDNSV